MLSGEQASVRLTWVDLATAPLTPVSEVEVERATRMQPDTARRYLAGRAALRHALGGWLALPARDVELDERCPRCREAHGKPRPAGVRPDHVDASLSRSGDLAVIAVAAGMFVGVDLERLRGVDRPVVRARRALGAAAAARVEAAPPGERPHVLLREWTVAESVAKAAGLGVRGGAHLRAAVRSWEATRVAALDAPTGHVGSICTARPRVQSEP